MGPGAGLQRPSMVEAKQFMSPDPRFYPLPMVSDPRVTILFLYDQTQGTGTE